MELKIKKEDFLKSLERTLSVVERRSTMPSLNHALLELKDESLNVSATDLEIFISSTVACKSLVEGRLAVPARSCYDIVKECEDGSEITLRTLDSSRIEIISNKSVFRLHGLAADSFPHFKASPKGELNKSTLNCKDFAKLISQTEFSVSTEEIRYFLTGVFFEAVEEEGKNILRCVATDGHRLSLMDAEQNSKNPLSLKKGLIIPKKGSTELRKLLESTDEESFELSCDENLIRANVGKYKLWIRPIDGEYPNYKPVIPKNLSSTLKVSRVNFLKSLKKMSLLVSDRSRVVTFEFQKKNIVMSTNNPDLGEAKDELSVIDGSAEVKTGFNVRFFIEAVNHFQGDEIELHVGEKLQPLMVTAKENPGYLAVIMPMRI